MEIGIGWTPNIVMFLMGAAFTTAVLFLTGRCARNPEHVLIPCKDTFEATRATLEKTIPPLDYAYREPLQSGNRKAALGALRALPRFNNFTKEPRDFGKLLDVIGKHGVKAVQYQIGNPLTATTMAKYQVEAGLFLPVTVLLSVDAGGLVAFKYVRPRSLMSQFKHRALYEAATQLDRDLLDMLSQIAGWDRPGQWNDKTKSRS
ncbi:hypothetical protein SLS62_002660 [Diatrype stigma]|uniref:DUF302 domain-containing protein n=1 Tax=Diatrype stigma TaxID=117547 RepID=A0AAN9YUU5_9PEZI